MRKPSLVARGFMELNDGRVMLRKGKAKGQVIAQVVTRHFGGHEEGGWWFDMAHTVMVKRCRLHNADHVARTMQQKLAERGIISEGNINSVLGGQEVIFFFSDTLPEPPEVPRWS